MIKILIVEDDNHLRQILSKYLIQIGYDVLTAFDGLNALNLLEHQKVDLVVTDVMMPHIDGNELSYTLRQMFPEMPILMLTALDQYKDKEKGFLSGVDDYLIKPIDLKELNLRIQAILRRYHIMVSHRIKLKHVMLDQKEQTCMINQTPVVLTHKEFQLIFKLLSYPNKIFTREELMDEIWGFDSESYERTVDTHIKRLRDHFQVEDFEIVTVRGLGYKVIINEKNID